MASLRVFIALLVPTVFSAQLEQQLLPLHQRLRGLQLAWLKKENYHFTLAFLGEIEMDKIEAIKALVDCVASNHAPISLEINRIDFFPSRKKVKVIAALPLANKQFDALYRDTVEQLQRSDYPVDNRGFKPHLTLARIKQKQLDLINLDGQELSLKYNFSAIVLMKSESTAQGMRYTPLYSRELCK